MGNLKDLKYLLNRYVLRRRFLVADTLEPPFSIRFKTEDAAGRRMYRRGNYEPHLTAFVSQYVALGQDDHAFDVGANLGWYSLLLNLQGSGNIHAFEPDPVNFSLLSENLERNGANNANATRAAVSDSSGTLTLHLYPDKNRGRHSALPINDGEKIEVESVSLDDYCRRKEIDPASVRFIKIDVEGFEPIALKGASEILRAKPIVLSEFAPEYMIKGGISIPDYLEKMFGYGFSCYRIDEDGIEKVEKECLLKAREAIDIVWSKEPIPRVLESTKSVNLSQVFKPL